MSDEISPIKVVVEHKKTITENVPEDVTRAKSGAWLDIISPLTQWAGLKGDELRHKRDMLRIEREANLLELAEALRARLDGKTVTPIKPKILIPSLERASLENREEGFGEMWANLLASEALEPADDTGLFSSILAEFGATEAKALDRIQERFRSTNLWTKAAIKGRDAVAHSVLQSNYLTAKKLLHDSHVNQRNKTEATLELLSIFRECPVWVFGAGYTYDSDNFLWLGERVGDQTLVAIDVLESRNLIEKKTFRPEGFMHQGDIKGVMHISYFDLTNLGVRFLHRVTNFPLI